MGDKKCLENSRKILNKETISENMGECDNNIRMDREGIGHDVLWIHVIHDDIL
jgi:hypothetical protein